MSKKQTTIKNPRLTCSKRPSIEGIRGTKNENVAVDAFNNLTKSEKEKVLLYALNTVNKKLPLSYLIIHYLVTFR